MRNSVAMKTKFWQKAYESLSPYARRRYAFHIRAAERWELRLDSAIERWARLKAFIAKMLHAPRSSPTH